MDPLTAAFAQAILTTYGVPGLALALIAYFLWKNQRQSPPGAVPQDIHVQLQFIRDTLIEIRTKLEGRK